MKCPDVVISLLISKKSKLLYTQNEEAYLMLNDEGSTSQGQSSLCFQSKSAPLCCSSHSGHCGYWGTNHTRATTQTLHKTYMWSIPWLHCLQLVLQGTGLLWLLVLCFPGECLVEIDCDQMAFKKKKRIKYWNKTFKTKNHHKKWFAS